MRLKQTLLRLVYIGLSCFVAIALPFFGDIAGFSGAVGFTPLTFMLPFYLWNSAQPTGGDDPLGVKNDSVSCLAGITLRRNSLLKLHTVLYVLYGLIGILAGVGAMYGIVQDASTFEFFG